MGWYRQVKNQCGLKNDTTSCWMTVLLFTLPTLMIPTFLGSPTAPPAVFLPPLAWIGGHLTERIGLPPTPAMLIMGLLFRALGWFELTKPWRRVAALTRYVAVAVVLVKGGLAVTRLPSVPLILFPCTAEATVIAVLAYYLLGFPFLWGYVFGFAMSAASSSVNAEKLAQLKKGGYGAKELYELILPTSTVENIYSITAFTVSLTMALVSSEAEWWVYTLKGPVAITCGVLFALSWGFLCSMFPNKGDEFLISKRSVLALLGACWVYLGAKEYGIAPGGPLGTMLTGVSLSFFWGAQGWREGKNPVLGVVSVVWNVLEAALFALVGAEVDVYMVTLQDLGIACIIMLASMLVRVVVFYLFMVIRREFSQGELLMAVLVWFPKATVLAALSPQVLDNVRKERGFPLEETSDEFAMGRMVLLCSVIEMIVTAPIGYILVNKLGHKILPRSTDEKDASASVALKSSARV